MQKSIILSLTFFVIIGMFSSCGRKCRGGGWYGDRNLGYVPQQKVITDQTCDLATLPIEELDCEEITD